MKRFIEWLNDKIDDSPITKIYDKAKISVDLVKKYKPEVLEGISVIANLGSGAYGVYTHYQLGDKRLIHYGSIRKAQANELPAEMVRKMYPDINANDLQKGDVIRVNVNRILSDPKVNSDFDAVVQIASTIVHECTHAQEVKATGSTSETGPERAEKEFMNLISSPEIKSKIIKALSNYPSTSRKVKNRLY